MDSNNSIIPGFDNEKDDSLSIALKKADGINRGIFIYLNGYIDTYNSSFFQKQITKVIEAGYINLVFNCSALNYVSSTGIGSFTVFLKIVKPKNGDVVLLEIQPKVYEVFQLLGFSQFFNIKNTVEEAISYFNAGDSSGTASSFPLIISCPVCNKKLRATKAGRFRCSGCRSILAINESGEVTLGQQKK